MGIISRSFLFSFSLPALSHLIFFIVTFIVFVVVVVVLFQGECTSLTLTDASKAMLELAVSRENLRKGNVPVKLALRTGAEDLSTALGGKQFDTVVHIFFLKFNFFSS